MFFNSWRRMRTRSHRWKKWLLVSLFVLVVLQEVVFLTAVVRLKFDNPRTSAFIEREGKRIGLHFVPLHSISPFLKRAVIIAEDSRFFEHNGADWQAIGEAMEFNLKKGRWVRGGSTITQQLAKNLFLSPERTPFRKLRELILSYEMEWVLGKKRILELYLNLVEWGDEIYGVSAASWHYFKKSPADLNSWQAVWLASILPNPDYFQRHPNHPVIRNKMETILNRMGE